MANCKKPQDIGEDLVQTAAMVNTIGAADIAVKAESIPLPDNSMKRKIDFISQDTLNQVIVH